ncbi:baseplate J/gp47 family protein [Flavilitoribacter nigricans]|uniref:Baseplate protein J-like domain-containing protein n=1 Tax=Flavilitoribacter nigricans (strain ATCC 23147 / DSM 23189 / NBRC 102662 / NCIMB 1420 / SS-2) TaxID=1122177 RepID=A0A2D0MYP7_FLAN2|nr:hypothetical protein [Flavilitoribacter nigricans]PHN01258.1 hypothetical protein CRP01_37910 [Flavilitoribacter nigricans DSM 23189 = NBRC 102662]
MPNQEKKYRIFRDGTSQQQRWKFALDPASVWVDERSFADLVEEMRCLAPQIAYYNDQNQLQGDWTGLLPPQAEINAMLERAELEQDLAPQLALLVTFLRLFRHAQDDLNGITERHLDFYYQDILQIKHQPPSPDQVHVLFELARNILQERIGEGALLKGGKDVEDKIRYYALEKEIVVHPARVNRLMSACIDTRWSNRIFSAQVANSADGLGAALPEHQPSWAPLGESQFGKVETARSMQAASVGFALSGPTLWLTGGKRSGMIELFTNLDHDLSDSDLADAFRLWFSTEKGWLEAKPVYTKKGSDNSIRINWSLTEKEPAIAPLPSGTDGAIWAGTAPVVKVVLNHAAPNYQYRNFSQLQVTHLRLAVEVEGLKNLALSNDLAGISAEKSFLPFGPQPSIGSSFYIGSEELAGKRINSLTVNWQWANLPVGSNGFADHYAAYAGALSNASFQADVSVFTDTGWINGPTVPLFQALSGQLQRQPYNQSVYNGNFRVVDPEKVARLSISGTDFGHRTFSERYTEIALSIANTSTFQDLPNPPYTPTIKSFSLSYTASAQIIFPSQPGTHRFFHLEPFGHFTAGAGSAPSIVPKIPNGSLYIGLEGLTAPRLLNFLFQCVEGSSDPDRALSAKDLHWDYLSGNDWIPILSDKILQDDTLGLQQAGIIQLRVDQAEVNGTRMPVGPAWLRLSTGLDTDLAPEGAARVQMLALNAVKATLEETLNHLEHLKSPLPAETIRRLQSPKPSIKRTAQPFPSFAGRSPEGQKAYYRRVSERLRHKQRAITTWDHERIVLQAFPEIYKVKCLAHTWDGRACAPGRVSLVVIPQIDLKSSGNLFEPKAGPALRERIRLYLTELIPSLFVEVAIVNPCYEPLRVCAKIKFRPGYDPVFYLNELDLGLQRLLAPWAFAEEEEITIGGRIFGSTIVKFMEKQPYVDYIRDFQLLHYPCRPCIGEMSVWNGAEHLTDDFVVYPLKADPVVASSPVSVLVSAEEHKLSEVDESCTAPTVSSCGIGNMSIEQDFKAQ